MSDQLALFSEPRARHDQTTSRVAAATVKPGHQQRLQRVAEIVGEAGSFGCIADEVWQRFCLDDPEYWRLRRSTIHGAVSRAAEAGLIHPRTDGARRLSVLNVVMTVYVSDPTKESDQ